MKSNEREKDGALKSSQFKVLFKGLFIPRARLF